MSHNHPNTGMFTHGNPGRRKGSKNTRTLQWDELGKELTDRHADRFNALLDRLWDSRDVNDHLRAAELFLKMAEYFKPKLQRVQIPNDGGVYVPRPMIIMGANPTELEERLPKSGAGSAR